MKKSFMTRALAMGLSFAMAFSLSAATNVTTAAAAAKPAMKNSKMTVKVGQTKNYNAKAATAKAYKITKTKVSSANKDKATVTVRSNKKGITVTGEKAVKNMNVRIYFKNTKTKKTTSVVSKLTVKEVITKQAIVSAEVTGASTITLTMAKDVASVESPVAITVKKGATTKDQKAAANGKTITITTDTKLTAGDYTVTITNLETDPLTASVNVAKNETLTTFEIGKELIANSSTNTTSGYIYYSAKNQYGERMTASSPSVSTSFSNHAEVTKTATASSDGKITVENINTALAIIGTKGTAVLVDSSTGVNASGEVTYSTQATAAEVEIVGIYDTIHSKFADNMKAQDKASNYYLLLTFKDQYGHEITDVSDLTSVTDNGINLAGGITKLELATPGSGAVKNFTVDGKDYIAVMFKNQTLEAGDATLTIVNNERGLLKTETIKVADNVLLASFTLNADNGLYNMQDNDMTFEAIDTNGNNVTDYATLKELVNFGGTSASNSIKLRMVRKADGTAKFIASPKFSDITSNDSNTATRSASMTYMLNSSVSNNYKVSTQLYTVYEERFIKTAYGLKAGTSTQVALGRELDIAYNKFVYEDQYANKVADGDHNYTSAVTTGAVVSKASIVITTTGSMDYEIKDDKLVFKPAAASDTATVYVKYYTSLRENTKPGYMGQASTTNYDFKFTVNCVKTTGAEASTLKLVSIFGGNEEDIRSTSASAIKAKDINVVVVQGGVETRIPDDQITIDSLKDNKISATETTASGAKVESKEATVNFTVTTFDDNNNPTYTPMTGKWTVSIKAPKIYKIDGTRDIETIDATSSGAVTAGALIKAFKFKDQYGKVITGAAVVSTASAVDYCDESVPGAEDVKYTANVLDSSGVKVYSTNSNGIRIVADDGEHGDIQVEVTATAPNGSTKTKKITIKF